MMSTLAQANAEITERFSCFGGSCSVIVQGPGPGGPPTEGAALAKRRLLAWHDQFSRFDPGSELSRLNADPRACVPVSAMMIRFVEAAIWAATLTSGLVDPTLLAEVERVGYSEDLSRLAPAPVTAQGSVGRRQAARPNAGSRWQEVGVGARARTISRPPGVGLDSGGIAKGLFGDVLASALELHAAYAVDAAGDIRLGGAEAVVRPVQVTSPTDGCVLHTFELSHGAVATSGIGKRRWLGSNGELAHHLLDPATGAAAFTGILQATALAPSGVEAEALAKASLLSGPDAAREWLPHGGVIVYDSGAYDVIEPRSNQVGHD